MLSPFFRWGAEAVRSKVTQEVCGRAGTLIQVSHILRSSFLFQSSLFAFMVYSQSVTFSFGVPQDSVLGEIQAQQSVFPLDFNGARIFTSWLYFNEDDSYGPDSAMLISAISSKWF